MSYNLRSSKKKSTERKAPAKKAPSEAEIEKRKKRMEYDLKKFREGEEKVRKSVVPIIEKYGSALKGALPPINSLEYHRKDRAYFDYTEHFREVSKFLKRVTNQELSYAQCSWIYSSIYPAPEYRYDTDCDED
jgi:hypothetical protein